MRRPCVCSEWHAGLGISTPLVSCLCCTGISAHHPQFLKVSHDNDAHEESEQHRPIHA